MVNTKVVEVSLVKMKGISLSKTAEVYSEMYKAFRNGGREELQSCFEEATKNSRLFVGAPSPASILHFLRSYQEYKEFEGNYQLRKHDVHTEVAKRGSKFTNFRPSARTIPYVFFKSVKTQGTGHMRMYVWWLALMGLLEYSSSVGAFIPPTLSFEHDVGDDTDDDHKMAEYAKSFDAKEHSFNGKSTAATSVYGTKWANETHPILKNVFLSKSSPVFSGDGARLEEDLVNDKMCEMFISLADKKSYLPVGIKNLLRFPETTMATAKLWWGISRVMVENSSRPEYDGYFEYVKGVLSGEIEMPSSAKTRVVDLEIVRSGLNEKTSVRYVGNAVWKNEIFISEALARDLWDEFKSQQKEVS